MSILKNKWSKVLLLGVAVVMIGLIAIGAGVYFLPPPQVLGEKLAVGEVQKIEVTSPLRIPFSRLMDKRSVENALRILPTHEGHVSWEGNTLVFTPAGGSWGMQKDYQLFIDSSAQDIFQKKLTESFYQRFEISGPPAVVMSLPKAIVEDRSTPITVVFDRAMIPATSIQARDSLIPPIKITPAVKGQFKWLGTNTVQYQPEQLLPATTYTVEVDKSMQDIYGINLASNFSWQFDTAHPDIVYSYPSSNYSKAGPNTEVIIRFNQAVDQSSLEQNIEWEVAESNQKVSFALRLEEEGTQAILTPQQPLAYQTKFIVTINQGLKSKEGQFSLQNPFVLPFTTVGLPIVQQSQPEQNAKSASRYGVAITFSNPMSSENIDQFIRIEPGVSNQFNDLAEVSENQSLSISGDFLPSTHYKVTLSKDWKDQYGQKMPYDFVLQFDTAPVTPDLAFVGRQRFGLIDGYGSEYQQMLQAINVAKVNLSLAKVDTAQVWDFLQSGKVAGVVLGTWQITSPNPLNEVVEIPVDLTSRLQNSGVYIMQASSVAGTQLKLSQAFMVSKTALTFKTFPKGGLVWATDLKSGLPIAGVAVSILSGPNKVLLSGNTDQDGVFAFTWPEGFTKSPDNYYSLPSVLVIGEYNGDLAIAGNDYTWNQGIEPWNYYISQSYAPETIRAFITTDRPLYQPGQEVFFKGIYRQDLDTYYQVLNAGTKIKTNIINPQGESVWEKELIADSHGTISEAFVLPAVAPVGTYTLTTQIENEHFATSFLVEEYQKPLFKVELATDQDEYIRDDEVKVAINANYYFGAPLAHAKLKYRVYSADYFFDRGAWSYSFSDSMTDCFYCDPTGESGKVWLEKTITTDERGQATLTIPATFNQQKESQLMSIEVGVEDPNTLQMIYTTKEVIIHKGDFYVGIANQNYVVKQKENATFLLQSLTTLGKPRGNVRGEVQMYKREYKTVKKRGIDGFFYYDTSFNDTLVKISSFATNNEGKGQIVFALPEGGQYHVVVRTIDSKGHVITSATDIWASSESYISWGRDNNDRLEIIPDREEYKVGDTAKLLVKSPYEGVKGLLTIERSGILEKKVIDITTTATTIDVPLKAEYLPNVFVSLTLVKGYGKDNIPGFKLGYINLRLNNESRKLAVSLMPDKKAYEPGNIVSVDMLVRDASNQPVSGDFAVAVVDQGLLALTGGRDVDLLERFFGQRSLAVTTYESLVNLIQRIDVKKTGGTKGGGGSDALAKRKNFKDTAYFNPHIVTDHDGKATIKFTLPDNTTTWQVWVFGATDKTDVGSATIQVVAQKSIFVDPILPRFLTNEDRVRIGAVIHNQTSTPVDTTISLNAEHVTIESSKQNIHIGSQSQQTVYWDTKVNSSATGATFTYSLQNEKGSDILEKSIPVVPWVSKETTTFGGILESNTALEQLIIPVGVISDTVQAGLHITSNLLDTTRAFYEGIDANTYESADVLAAKLIALSLNHNLSVQQKNEQSSLVLQKLYTYAQNDGGFTYYPGNNESSPFLSAQVTLAFHIAVTNGLHVDDWILNRAKEFVTQYFYQAPTEISSEVQASFTAEGRVSAQRQLASVLTDKAFIAYVLTLSDDTSISTQGLFDRYQELPLIGQGYLTLALQNQKRDQQAQVIIAAIKNKLIKSGNLAHFEESSELAESMSKVHLNSVLLNVFMQEKIASNLQIIHDLVRYIVIARTAQEYNDGYGDSNYIWAVNQWLKNRTTQENTTWSIWVNETPVVTSTQVADIDISSFLTKENLASNTIVIQKSSPGPLYYWGYMSYEVRGENAQPRTEGLSIYREYYDLADKGHLYPLTTFNRGQDVQVKLTVIVPADQNFAVIEDNLPAGLTAQNFVFATASSWQEHLLDEINNLKIDRQSIKTQLGPLNWDYQEIRDNRVITYAHNLPRGVYTVSYLAKAGIQGAYKVKPARIFLQRAPDMFGTTAVENVIVK